MHQAKHVDAGTIAAPLDKKFDEYIDNWMMCLCSIGTMLLDDAALGLLAQSQSVPFAGFLLSLDRGSVAGSSPRSRRTSSGLKHLGYSVTDG